RERQSGRVIGSTRFMDIQQTHHTLELGSTWLIRECQGTGLNAEAKYLQLQHAFEKMGASRVALKTHHQNLRSQAAMRAIGARQEGIFRNHYIMPDGSPRHSVWFSVIREDWPQVKTHLEQRMARFFA
ncbi:MAG TPA: GNAT family protein, partial [Acidobacteriaceae bacterium]|nr:GNAT family protein [Acidobacteriaceae bacterium]